MLDTLAKFKRGMHHAVTTVGGPPHSDAIERALQISYQDKYAVCRFSVGNAPGDRGIELHATSDEIDKDHLKEGLRKTRAFLEAGELPTGARS